VHSYKSVLFLTFYLKEVGSLLENMGVVMGDLFIWVLLGVAIGGPVGFWADLPGWLLILLSVGVFVPFFLAGYFEQPHPGKMGLLLLLLLPAVGFAVGLWVGTAAALLT
jgi:hypothetical protein